MCNKLQGLAIGRSPAVIHAADAQKNKWKKIRIIVFHLVLTILYYLTMQQRYTKNAVS